MSGGDWESCEIE